MDKKRMSFKQIGALLLLIGIISLVVGILLLMFADLGFSFWIIIASIILNIVGINFLIAKKTEE